MNLDEAQKKTVSLWIKEGHKLAEIQKRLLSEFGLTLTYMEVRFLMDDLKLAPQDPVAPEPEKKPEGVPAENAADAAPPAVDDEDAITGVPGSVSVTVDQLAVPGTIVSGKVSFSDGKSADWYLDQMGRLGVKPQQAGYKPSQTDLMAFQSELQNVLAKMGL